MANKAQKIINWFEEKVNNGLFLLLLLFVVIGGFAELVIWEYGAALLILYLIIHAFKWNEFKVF